MKINIDELSGVALDYAVACCESRHLLNDPMKIFSGSVYIWEDKDTGYSKTCYMRVGSQYSPSTKWEQGGPIIEREGLHIQQKIDKSGWSASYSNIKSSSNDEYKAYFSSNGESPLIAAMRCYVASKREETIYIPDYLK